MKKLYIILLLLLIPVSGYTQGGMGRTAKLERTLKTELHADMSDTADVLRAEESAEISDSLEAYLQNSGLAGILVGDSFRFVQDSLFDGDLRVTLPPCTVTFGHRIVAFSQLDTTVAANIYTYFYVHADSADSIRMTTGNNPAHNITLASKIVSLGIIAADEEHVSAYFPEIEAFFRGSNLESYIQDVHSGLIISGMTVEQGASGSRQIKMNAGVFREGITNIDQDSLLSSSVGTDGDTVGTVHWGEAGSDSSRHFGEMDIDSVWSDVLGRLVEVTDNKYYKALAYFHDHSHLKVQTALASSKSNNAASAQTKDAPTISETHSEDVLELAWIIFKASTDNSTNNFDDAVFVDVRTVHGSASGTGVTDHGKLTGLTDDDHKQYQLRSEVGDSIGQIVNDSSTVLPMANLIFYSTANVADTLINRNYLSPKPFSDSGSGIATSEANGFVGSGLTFSTNDSLSRPFDAELIETTGSFSLGFWYKTGSVAANEDYVVTTRDLDDTGWTIFYLSGSDHMRFQVSDDDNSTTDVITGGTATDDDLYHSFWIIRDTVNVEWRLIIDDVVTTIAMTNAVGDLAGDANQTMIIGSGRGLGFAAGDGWDGELDEIMYWDTALNDRQVIYLNQKSILYPGY